MPGVGQRVAGRYRIARPLGSGGLGRVWLAVDEMLHRDVAIKKCAPPDGLAPDERELLRSWMPIEARAAGRVSHPNVIRIYDVLPGRGEPWIVMEYVPSRSLLEVIKESGPLGVGRLAGIGLALLAALEAAHRLGVLHLDVKPSNVLIADDGRVVLTDFGPAVTGEAIAALARRGMMFGSPNYVSPERLFDGAATAQADLWSLGATLYHAVEGRPPYVRETSADTLRALAGSPPDRIRLAGPLTPVLDGLLRRDPGTRMTAAEAEARLSELTAVSSHPAPAVRRGPAPGPAARGLVRRSGR
ncbi:serine/threonine-protein kinase, partial [Actinoplanes sp. NPDC026623]|uniref:serine/threonine-protein kinase n=1 Tax=Actinoplanes sp. NPDC026623 TaxID=3155610 RepID=UPI0033DC83CB